MESPDDDDDIKLIKASAGLLNDLESALPKLLWRQAKTGGQHGRVHTQVKQRDLNYVIKSIEPFQGEPQLLDARLKHILPPIVEAYIEYVQLEQRQDAKPHVDLETAVCTILYTLCKVRGYKVIVGFFNNEARYLELILAATERASTSADGMEQTAWQVHYILLLWLSHLLLTPFDLSTISSTSPVSDDVPGLELPAGLPPLTTRCLDVGLHFLPTSTKAQDAAAAMLVRLAIRPDMQKLYLGDSLVQYCLRKLEGTNEAAPTTIYERIGPLRILAGIASSAELSHLVPSIYRTCERLAEDEGSFISSNAVVKKLTVKIFRNIAILCLRSAAAEGPLLSFLESSGVLENVIDYLLRSLGDRDTPVRYASAKAISLIVQELEPAMGHEVIQAVLDTFKEDMPRDSKALDFRNANALRWHGLTLALAHALFKRTASPEQLPDIVNALVAALQFEQRTTTGSSMGTNVRDAANFGIWSLSRRYTTKELLSVKATDLHFTKQLLAIDATLPIQFLRYGSVIHMLAIQLILSACLDPAGNIRRGSSAALQELIGRHPNQVHKGIELVQVVDYQAVGLRRRAMVDVAPGAANLCHPDYWTALIHGCLGWRGIGSPDVPSREAAAASLAMLSTLSVYTDDDTVLDEVIRTFDEVQVTDVETLHGLALAAALTIPKNNARADRAWSVLDRLVRCFDKIQPRMLRSELPAAAAKLITALCKLTLDLPELNEATKQSLPFNHIDVLTERLLARQESHIMETIPDLVQSLLALKRRCGKPLGCLGALTLVKQVAADSARSTLGGAGRAIALGALGPMYDGSLSGDKAAAVVRALVDVTGALSVDWRVVGLRALQLAVDGTPPGGEIDVVILKDLTNAVHCGLNDYTIDERGDVGSLARLQAIACSSSILSRSDLKRSLDCVQELEADVIRLSFEKLDRVRIQAAKCRQRFLAFEQRVTDIASVSTYAYFEAALSPLRSAERQLRLETAVLEGCVSCAGVAAEDLLQASRAAIADTLDGLGDDVVCTHLTTLSNIVKAMVVENGNAHPALELLAFPLDMQIPQRLSENPAFKWRNLLSTVQKAHHKSNDIPKILAAVHVYRGLADIAVIRDEVVKKLLSMLKTNPYPRVRMNVAETLFVVTKAEELKERDWGRPVKENAEVVARVLERIVPP